MGAFILQPIEYGKAIPASKARDHVFGFMLMNDWSARDIQFYKIAPLGPFNGKATATSISVWVVTLDILRDTGALIPSEPGKLVGGKATSVPFLIYPDDLSVRVTSHISSEYNRALFERGSPNSYNSTCAFTVGS